jgi:hypothetical protein
VKSQQRLAVLAALGGTVALAGWLAAGLAGLGSLVIESTGASIEVSRATSATARAEHVDAPQATALGGDGVSVADTGRGDDALSDPPPMPRPAAVPVGIASLSTPDPERNEAKEATGSVKVADTGRDGVALSDPPPLSRPATPSVRTASLSTPDPVRNEAKERKIFSRLCPFLMLVAPTDV